MTAEPRDVEEITGDLAAWRGKPPGEGAETRRRFLDIVSSRLAADVEPLLARLAAADRKNAELRGEVADWERQADEHYADLVSARSENVDLRAAILRNVDTHADLSTQLAAAQAQLAEAQVTIRAFVSAAPQPEPPASDEPARTPDLMAALRATVEAAKERRTSRADHNCVPEGCSECRPECRHCNGSGNAHTFDGADVGICGTCHGTGSAAGGGL